MKNLLNALKILDMTGKITFQYIVSDRIAVYVNDEYFGIWDTSRKTFVD